MSAVELSHGLSRQLTTDNQVVPSLAVSVGPGAAMCLDLVLGAASVDVRTVRVGPDGVTFSVDIIDVNDGRRLASILKQHLGVELHRATIFHNGTPIQVAYEPIATQREAV